MRSRSRHPHENLVRPRSEAAASVISPQSQRQRQTICPLGVFPVRSITVRRPKIIPGTIGRLWLVIGASLRFRWLGSRWRDHRWREPFVTVPWWASLAYWDPSRACRLFHPSLISTDTVSPSVTAGGYPSASAASTIVSLVTSALSPKGATIGPARTRYRTNHAITLREDWFRYAKCNCHQS